MNHHQEFKKIFKTLDNGKVYFSPGRINLIGEHLDYNGGLVLPCTIDLGIYALVQKNDNQKLRLYSTNYSQLGVKEDDIQHLKIDPDNIWTNYPKALLLTLKKHQYSVDIGLDIYYYATLPEQSGLSSSAALLLVTLLLINDLFNLKISHEMMAKIAWDAETDIIKLKCGIMDQFVITSAKKNKALLLNTQNLLNQDIDIKLIKNNILVINSNVKRDLTKSLYNSKVLKCQKILTRLQQFFTINYLADLTMEDYTKCCKYLSKKEQPILKHIISENIRVKDFVKQLSLSNIRELGNILNASYLSLKNDYQVSCPEIDFLITKSLSFKGVYGARITGAGFGGSIIILLKKEVKESIFLKLNEEYKKKYHRELNCYDIKIGSELKII